MTRGTVMTATAERRSPRRLIPYAAIALITAVVVAAATTAIVKSTESNASGNTLVATQRHPYAVVITVQNKVALGPDSLIEDSTPAYLSSTPVPYCSRLGCEVPGTQVSSGAMLVAVCYTHGAEMYNYNLDSTASQNNPNRASSSLWYKVVFPDGRSGYISVVYVVASNRGGMGLAICR